jgi:hypothetical protein
MAANTVNHHFRESVPPGRPTLAVMYHEPQQHAFGEGDGQKMLEHVAKHLGIKD